jgi:hypothetical protein
VLPARLAGAYQDHDGTEDQGAAGQLHRAERLGERGRGEGDRDDGFEGGQGRRRAGPSRADPAKNVTIASTVLTSAMAQTAAQPPAPCGRRACRT